MKSIWLLTLLELRSAYGINKFLHTRDPKAKSRYRLLLGALVLVIAVVCFYMGTLVYGLCLMGLGEIVPMYLAVLASLLILAFGIFTAGASLFGPHSYDILSALPIKPEAILAGRFCNLYLQDLGLTLLIFLPGLGVYAFLEKPGFSFYAAALAVALALPGLPLVASSVVGTVIMAVSSGRKRKSMVQTVLMLTLVTGILGSSLALAGTTESLTAELLASLAANLGQQLRGIYPPAAWAGKAMLGSMPSLLAFVAVSLSLVALTVWLVGRNYPAIMERLGSFPAHSSYQLGVLESKSLAKALYLREARRYFSSPIYVTNTIIGPIMGVIMAVALSTTGLGAIQSTMPMDITPAVPFAFSAVFTLMTTTACAISMEGKQWWLTKSLPIPTKALLDSKLLLNLSLMLPCYLAAEVLLILTLRPTPLALVWLALIPAAIMAFAVVLGITINLKFHSFDWEKEAQVVKQGASSAIGGFAGPLVSLALGALVLAIPAPWQSLVNTALVLGLAAATLALYRRNNQADLAAL